MEPEDNAAPEGESEHVGMSEEAAAEALMALENPPEETTETKTEGAEAPTEAQAEEANPDEESEPETESEDDDIVHGNKYVLLRNGDKVRVGDLKKLWDKAPELERRESEITQRQQQFQAEAQKFQTQQTHIAQQAQALQQLAPLVLAKAQGDIPPEVPEDLWKSDPIEAMSLDRARNRKINEFQQLQNGLQTFWKQKQDEYQQTVAEQQKAQAEKLNAYAETEFKALLEEVPALRDEAKRKVFSDNILKGAKAYGFEPAQLAEVKDRRLLKALADLGQYQALRSQKPVVQQKVAAAPPVRAPGKRTSENEQAASERKALSERASRSGRVEDAADLIALLED